MYIYRIYLYKYKISKIMLSPLWMCFRANGIENQYRNAGINFVVGFKWYLENIGFFIVFFTVYRLEKYF